MTRAKLLSLVRLARATRDCGALDSVFGLLVGELIARKRRSAARGSVTKPEIQLLMYALIEAMQKDKCPISTSVQVAFGELAGIKTRRRDDPKRPHERKLAAFFAGAHLAQTGKMISARTLARAFNEPPHVAISTAAKWLKDPKITAEVHEWKRRLDARRSTGSPKKKR